MSKFNEIQRCVNTYYDQALLQGHKLISVVDMFKNGPLPPDLLDICKGFEHSEIRRHGQLVGTRYLIKESEQQSAQLPSTDLLATTD